MRYFWLLTISQLILVISAFGQDDPTLFTIDDVSVTKSEFDYTYQKSNGDKADYSKQSLEEYLQLYINFKLKVLRAREMQIDTIPSLQRELDSYRHKLANSYLIDREVTDKLVEEAYDRMQYDVQMSHIFAEVKMPSDTTKALEKLKKAKIALDRGDPWDQVAKNFSDDPSVRENFGNIGYFTAMFPEGFYAMETTAYTAPMNKVVGPIRTSGGYHLLKVTDKRPARGEMEIAQILIRTKDNDDAYNEQAYLRAQDALKTVLAGESFEDVARQISEDKASAANGGYVGFVGINLFERKFEDAVFNLQNDGDITEVVQSELGYHIVKRISHKTLKSLEDEHRAIQAKVLKDPRHEISKRSLINKIKSEAGFKDDTRKVRSFIQDIDDSFYTHKWEPTGKHPTIVFMTIGDKEYTRADFEEYARAATRIRLRYTKGTPLDQTVFKVYNAYVDEKVMEYEEANLPNKYPEFKALLREYEEGILLFEIAQGEVWNKAAQDSVGLAAFYPTVKDNYMWEERGEFLTYTLNSADPALIKCLKKYISKNWSSSKITQKINQKAGADVVKIERATIEKSHSGDYANNWIKNAIVEEKTDTEKNTFTITKLVNIIPPEPKALNEARGYIIADYQDYLEKQWVKELRSDYTIIINRDVFNSLVH